MAYSTKDLEKQALKAITEHQVIFFDELTAYLPCSAATLYNHELEKLETIKNAISQNRINQKKHLRDQWSKEKAAPVLQLALYKLLSNDDELSRLSVKDKDPEQQDQTVSFKFTEVK